MLVIDGNHLNGRNDNDVSYLQAVSSTIHLIPNGLFKKFANLARLVLNDVGINSFGQMNGCKLNYLDVERNAIFAVPSQAFVKCSATLQLLSLANNKISEIDANAFSSLSNISRLFLDINEISTFPTTTFHPLIGLEVLTLSHNRLETISAEIFKTNIFMNILRLNNNRINAIQRGWHQSFRNLQQLSFADNDCISKDYTVFFPTNSTWIDFQLCFDNFEGGQSTTANPTTTINQSTIMQETTTLKSSSLVVLWKLIVTLILLLKFIW